MTKRVCVIPGDDSAPEAVLPALGVLRAMELDIDYTVLPSGEDGMREHGDDWERIGRDAVDATDTTLFGSTSGKTRTLRYLRWGKRAFANVRPVRYMPGANSPLREPEGIDFVIIRENMEDMYTGVEGDLTEIAPMNFVNRFTGDPLAGPDGRFAIKVITEEASRRVIRFGFELARKRKAAGHRGRLTVSSKYNMLPRTDGLFRDIGRAVAKEYPDIEHEEFIVDDFARRIVATPLELDVVVLPNLYGDILSDEASALVGGLGVTPSGCYAENFAYFEPVHGTAPDITGTGTINPTATLLSAVMMLEHLGMEEDASALEGAVQAVYAEGRHLTPDQGGSASSEELCKAVAAKL